MSNTVRGYAWRGENYKHDYGSEATFVYVAKAIGINRAKIGISGKPADRVRSFSVGSPVPIRLEMVIDPDLQEPTWTERASISNYKTPAKIYEELLHEYFRDKRVHREWFTGLDYDTVFAAAKIVAPFVQEVYDRSMERVDILRVKRLNAIGSTQHA